MTGRPLRGPPESWFEKLGLCCESVKHRSTAAIGTIFAESIYFAESNR